MSSGYIVGVNGGIGGNYLPWEHHGNQIVTFPPDCRPAFNDEHPIDIKVSDNWKDDWNGEKDHDYPVIVEVYRPPNRMLWKCQILRSRLAKKPDLVRLEVPS